MSKLFTFEIGNHHCIVMYHFDAMAVAAGCIMDTFSYRNAVVPNGDCLLAVMEDRHAIIDNAYPIADIGLERYINGEASKINLEFTPINEYPELLYDATFHCILGLMSHYFHDCVNPNVSREYISDLKEIACNDEREDVRHAIIDAFNYASTHISRVYEINSWYYDCEEKNEA